MNDAELTALVDRLRREPSETRNFKRSPKYCLEVMLQSKKI